MYTGLRSRYPFCCAGVSCVGVKGVRTGLRSIHFVEIATMTRHLDRLGQLSEFEQAINTESEQESNTDSHSTQNNAQAAQQAMTEAGERRRRPTAVTGGGTRVQCTPLMSL